MNSEVVIAILVSSFGFLNVIITIYFSPKIANKFSKETFEREKLFTVSISFLEYLTDALSLNDFNEVPSTIRKYSLSIHMLFDSGKAPNEISLLLESIFKKFKEHRESGLILSSDEKEFIRKLIQELRKELSFYINNGVNIKKK